MFLNPSWEIRLKYLGKILGGKMAHIHWVMYITVFYKEQMLQKWKVLFESIY